MASDCVMFDIKGNSGTLVIEADRLGVSYFIGLVHALQNSKCKKYYHSEAFYANVGTEIALTIHYQKSSKVSEFGSDSSQLTVQFSICFASY